MPGILAIDTASDACSVALMVNGEVRQRHELAPRRHSQLIFHMLRELLPCGTLRDQGVEAIAYGSGPGSFTGLRIAVSAVQGLAYANDLPVVSVPTLAVLAQTAVRIGAVGENDLVLATLDARINEVYAAVYAFEEGLARRRAGPWAAPPGELDPQTDAPVHVLGDGAAVLRREAALERFTVKGWHPELLPQARDMIPLALARLAAGRSITAAQARPMYVRDEVNWKKLPEQGRRG